MIEYRSYGKYFCMLYTNEQKVTDALRGDSRMKAITTYAQMQKNKEIVVGVDFLFALRDKAAIKKKVEKARHE